MIHLGSQTKTSEEKGGRISVTEDKIKAMYTSIEKNIKSKIIQAQSIHKI